MDTECDDEKVMRKSLIFSIRAFDTEIFAFKSNVGARDFFFVNLFLHFLAASVFDFPDVRQEITEAKAELDFRRKRK